jgi:hypothetical protein
VETIRKILPISGVILSVRQRQKCHETPLIDDSSYMDSDNDNRDEHDSLAKVEIEESSSLSRPIEFNNYDQCSRAYYEFRIYYYFIRNL